MWILSACSSKMTAGRGYSMYLLDTNVLSEIRKIRKGTANAGVRRWAEDCPKALMYISAITLLELERGTVGMEVKDATQGAVYRRWLEEVIKPQFHGKVLPIDAETAVLCAKMHVLNRKGFADSLIAATALRHNMLVVTRNEKDFAHLGARIFNPFED